MNLPLLVYSCPSCGQRNDQHATATGDMPGDGDISVCFYCVEVSIFVDGADGLALRTPTPAERDEILTNPSVRTARVAIAESTNAREAIAFWKEISKDT